MADINLLLKVNIRYGLHDSYQRDNWQKHREHSEPYGR